MSGKLLSFFTFLFQFHFATVRWKKKTKLSGIVMNVPFELRVSLQFTVTVMIHANVFSSSLTHVEYRMIDLVSTT